MAEPPQSTEHDGGRRPVALLATFGVLVAAVLLAVFASPSVFPPSAVLLSTLVAAALLPPADTVVVGVLCIASGALLARYNDGYTGAAFWYRLIFLSVGVVLAIALSFIRRRREREIARNAERSEMHAFTSAIFAESDINAVAHVVAQNAPALIGATSGRVVVIDGDRFVFIGDSTDSTAPLDSISMSTPCAALTAVRRMEPVLFTSRADYLAAFPDWERVYTAIDAEAAAVFPMAAHGTPIGALMFFYQRARRFSESEIVLGRQLAHEVAAALERAQLREGEQAAAIKLQESLLGPRVLVRGVGHEARYLPAEASLHVGGDWYTAQRLSDGRVGIAVGDVVGHGLDAAIVMGQLRSALTAYAGHATTTSETLTYLDDFARAVPGAESASIALARVDVWSHQIEYSLAGHPPPVLVSPTGKVELLDDAVGWPLAVRDDSTARPMAAKPFPPGAMVLLYSDGLIERRNESLDIGLDRLCRVVERNWNRPLSALCDAVTASLLAGRHRTDDAAVLALRSPGANADLFLCKVDATPAGLTQARTELRSWLADLGVDPDDTMAILIAIGEATMNAVEHAYGATGGLLRVEAAALGNVVECCVTDTGRWHDNASRTARGNGIPIMRELMEQVRVERRRTGTTVAMRYRLATRSAGAALV